MTRTTSQGILVHDSGDPAVALAAGLPTADSVDAAISRYADSVNDARDARDEALAAAEVAGDYVTQAQIIVGAAADDAEVDAAIATVVADVAAVEAGLAGKVDKGAIAFNVRDYGALGTWTSGTSGADDTVAVRAAIAAAYASITLWYASPSVRVLVPASTGRGYRITDTITVPNGVELDMRAPFVYGGPAGRAALVVGTEAAQHKRTHTIRCVRATTATWLDEADAGVVLRNHYTSTFHLLEVESFTVGVVCLGDNSNGFSYNSLFLGGLIDHKVAIDLTNDTGGWCNENLFYNGRFAHFSTTHTDKDRIGIRSTSRQATPYYNNANIFLKPSFEIRGGLPASPIEGLCVQVVYGMGHVIKDARVESPDATVMRTLNDSRFNAFESAYDVMSFYDGVPTPIRHEDNGTYSSTVLKSRSTAMTDEATRLVYKADNLSRRACHYAGSATSVHVPGLVARASSATLIESRGATGPVIGSGYLELGNAAGALGFYLSTRTMRRFSLLADAMPGFPGRWIVSPYDASGNPISTAGTVRSDTPGWFYATAYGSAWRWGVDFPRAVHAEVSAATDHVWVGLGAGTAVARIRSLAVYSPDFYSGAAWLPTTDLPGANYGTAAPTSGTWAAGRRVYNAAPGAGDPEGWICTAAGTPGTWKTFGAIGA